ncbi:vitamin B12-dependent ribonucleotide reductase, partial [Streptomyces althioticus]
LREDRSFDHGLFAKVVELVITAMDISICFADFPTQKITKVSRAYRQLGIGYANLGAMLMAAGLPYDSDSGRSLAGAVTSLMTATSYRRSAEIAAQVGPYDGYAPNAKAHQQVLDLHQAANDRATNDTYGDVWAAAGQAWTDARKLAKKHGVRNAQASLLAPTGTSGLTMGVDTTGVEPDFSLVKFKKLVGGASMTMVNGTVERALAALGYSKAGREAIVAHITEHGHVVGAPGMEPGHYPVFDCANGERAIDPMGHVRMMAAVQPFLSGAISKTCNLPESATVEDIESLLMESWKLGLKCVAVYRDNCKVGQPLSAKSAPSATTGAAAPAAGAAGVGPRRPPPPPRGNPTVRVGGGAGGHT